ncbi:hypothetical protein [Rhodococcus sp. 06-235-1A]|uniref:hypothetical protein n=1 Tax=Rhodococcus sp. 06-235-1A TaxID=2022508 RepID=UPI00211B1782|nr:hypothetical protein [Rhodococcus sp. 06-235-1A]
MDPVNFERVTNRFVDLHGKLRRIEHYWSDPLRTIPCSSQGNRLIRTLERVPRQIKVDDVLPTAGGGGARSRRIVSPRLPVTAIGPDTQYGIGVHQLTEPATSARAEEIGRTTVDYCFGAGGYARHRFGHCHGRLQQFDTFRLGDI